MYSPGAARQAHFFGEIALCFGGTRGKKAVGEVILQAQADEEELERAWQANPSEKDKMLKYARSTQREHARLHGQLCVHLLEESVDLEHDHVFSLLSCSCLVLPLSYPVT